MQKLFNRVIEKIGVPALIVLIPLLAIVLAYIWSWNSLTTVILDATTNQVSFLAPAPTTHKDLPTGATINKLKK